MKPIHRNRALLTTCSAVALGFLLTPNEAVAQAQGDVQIKQATSPLTQSLDNIQRLLQESPEEQKTVNVYVTPQYRRESYQAYDLSGSFDILTSDGDVIETPLSLNSPKFKTESEGVSIGADYLHTNNFLFGVQFNLNKTEFDYDDLESFDLDSLFIDNEEEFRNVFGDFAFGDPVDREFDEYGISFSGGYVSDPWTFLVTAGYAHRDNESRTRNVGSVLGGIAVDTLVELESNFGSDIYSVEAGGSYRLQSGPASFQPFASIAYQVEDVEEYTGELVAASELVLFDRDGDGAADDFSFAPINDPSGLLGEGFGETTVEGQTIHSVPLKIGALFSAPLLADASGNASSPFSVRAGLSFTHDFSDQERTIRGERNPAGLVGQEFTGTVEEENRNRNFFSANIGLGYDFSGITAGVDYQRDIGLDERESADTLSATLRIGF